MPGNTIMYSRFDTEVGLMIICYFVEGDINLTCDNHNGKRHVFKIVFPFSRDFQNCFPLFERHFLNCFPLFESCFLNWSPLFEIYFLFFFSIFKTCFSNCFHYCYLCLWPNFPDKKYSVIHFTGYLKSWAPTKDPLEEDSESDSDSCNLSCLVWNLRSFMMILWKCDFVVILLSFWVFETWNIALCPNL